MASDLLFSAAKLRGDPANHSILTCVGSSDSGLLDASIDLNLAQVLSLSHHLIGLLLQLLLNWKESLRGRSAVLRLKVLISDIVLHPVDVKRAWLGTVDRRSRLFLNDFDHFVCLFCLVVFSD